MKQGIMKRWLFSLAVVCLAIVEGCSWGKVQIKNYYIISYTPSSPTPASSKRPYPYSIQVGRFEVQRIFNRQSILYRFSPQQIQYYELHDWAVRPDFMVTDMVLRHLATSNLTNRVGLEYFETRPDFRIEGTVEALEKFDAGDMFFAHLAMTFKLLRVRDGTQIWEYSFDQRRQVYQEEMVYTVRGLSSILQSQMDIVVSNLDSLFLTMSSGPAQVPAATVKPSEKPAAQETSPDRDVDESTFEIIPEKPRK